MIDFAHAVPVDGDGEDGQGPATAPGDQGYLYGLKNVRRGRVIPFFMLFFLVFLVGVGSVLLGNILYLLKGLMC